MQRSVAPPPAPGPLRRALTAWLFAGAPPFVARAIHRALRQDVRWSAWYDALRRVERVGSSQALGTSQRELLEGLVLDAVAPAPHERSSFLLRPGIAAAAACGALLLFFVFPEATAPPAGDAMPALTERSLGEDAPLVGVKLRCLDSTQRHVLAHAQAGPSAPGAMLQCEKDNLLAFSLTNLSDAEQHIFAVGVSGTGELRWYAPFERGADAMRVQPGEIDRPLETAADLSRLPDDERVTLHLLFSRAPLNGESIRRELSSASRRGVLSTALDRLPIDVEHQAHVEIVRRRAP